MIIIKTIIYISSGVIMIFNAYGAYKEDNQSALYGWVSALCFLISTVIGWFTS